MFTSEKVPNYIQTVKFSGDEAKPLLTVSFYITPLEYEILYEVSDRLAKQLYRREGTNHVPISELGKTVLNLGELGSFNLEFYPHSAEGADGAGQMVAACAIGEVYVDKLFTDKPDWSLVWKAILPMDSHSIELMRKYFRKTCFITLKATQDGLFDEVDEKPATAVIVDDATVECVTAMTCQSCNEPAIYLDSNQAAWCGDHVSAAVGAQVRRIVLRESGTLALPSEPEDDEPVGEFINRRNKRERTKKSVEVVN